MSGEDWFRIRNIWYGMRYRCYNEKSKGYRWYGGRGIRICDRWLNFDNFYEDMKSEWFEGATIDRIDSDGDYTQDNCRWITKQDNLYQANLGKSNERRSETIKRLRGDTVQSQNWRASLKGIPKSEEHKKKTGDALRNRKKPSTECEYCGRTISTSNIKRHQDSCNGKSI